MLATIFKLYWNFYKWGNNNYHVHLMVNYVEELSAALVQMVACLPLVHSVQGSIPSEVENVLMKILNLGARKGEDVQFLIARWFKFHTVPQYICWEGIFLLLLAISPSDGDLSLAVPFVLINRSRPWSGTGFHLLPFFHHHNPTYNTLTLQTITNTLTSLLSIHKYRYTFPHVTYVNRHLQYSHSVEPEAHNSAVGWH